MTGIQKVKAVYYFFLFCKRYTRTNIPTSPHICCFSPWSSRCCLWRIFSIANEAMYMLHPRLLHHLQIGVHATHFW